MDLQNGLALGCYQERIVPEVLILLLYVFRQDYLIQHGGYGNQDFVVETPALTENVSLTPEQTEVGWPAGLVEPPAGARDRK